MQMKLMDKSFVALAVIVLSLAVTLVGLIIDRRAPVVLTLVYVTVAEGYPLLSPDIATLTIGLYVLERFPRSLSRCGGVSVDP